MSENRGRFIVLEGPDGAGKTTLATALHDWLVGRRVPTIRTREIGGTPFAERIRELVLSNGTKNLDCEAILCAAARRHHTDTLIRPALDAGSWVISDRYFLSTVTHQHGASNMDMITQLGTGGLVPDLTLVLDMEFEVAQARARYRGGRDHTDSHDEATYTVRRNLLRGYVRDNPDRAYLIRAEHPFAIVEETAQLIIAQRFLSTVPYQSQGVYLHTS